MSHDKKNIMVVLSSPSGAGKTTITKKIQQKFNSFKISVSHTTRKPRSNEVDGVDYNFVSNDKFEQLIKEKKFYEHAKIFDNYYGTLKQSVDDLIKTNDIIFVDGDFVETFFAKSKFLSPFHLFVDLIKSLILNLLFLENDIVPFGAPLSLIRLVRFQS